MRRVVVTGVACIGPVPGGVAEHVAAARAGVPVGQVERVDTLRGRRRTLRRARMAPFERESFVPPHKLRRMDDVSQIWTIACLSARADAGLDAAAYAPERRATFLGTGFGCVDSTWSYLAGIAARGAAAANPFLFSESVANAPAGHSAVELDARGPTCTLTCGDASAIAAVVAGARAIADARADVAFCGGIELLPAPLVRVLAAIGRPGFIGEGCVGLVLEAAESARARGARIHAEVLAWATASDPRCGLTEWSADSERMEAVLRRAARVGTPCRVRRVFLHAGGSPAADAAETRAAASAFPDATAMRVSHVFGSLAAAGGFGLAVAAHEAATISSGEADVVAAWSWGGGLHALSLGGPRP